MNGVSYECQEKGNSKKSQKQKTDKSNSSAAFSAIFLSAEFNKHSFPEFTKLNVNSLIGRSRNGKKNSTVSLNCWYIDSGATRHMTIHRDWIDESKSSFLKDITAANNQNMKFVCSGTTKLKIDNNEDTTDIDINNVLCVLELAANLLSVS